MQFFHHTMRALHSIVTAHALTRGSAEQSADDAPALQPRAVALPTPGPPADHARRGRPVARGRWACWGRSGDWGRRWPSRTPRPGDRQSAEGAFPFVIRHRCTMRGRAPSLTRRLGLGLGWNWRWTRSGGRQSLTSWHLAPESLLHRCFSALQFIQCLSRLLTKKPEGRSSVRKLQQLSSTRTLDAL